MMNRKKFYDCFAKLTEQEEACRKLYRARPEVFRQVPRNWEEFCSFFLKENEKEEELLPARAPIEMDEWLTESMFSGESAASIIVENGGSFLLAASALWRPAWSRRFFPARMRISWSII